MTIPDPMAEKDYITWINIEMMSGGGADIYVNDVLPYYKYADSGQFVDLREFMDNDSDFDYKDYQKGVFDAVMYRGGQYILPFNYNYEIITRNKKMNGDFDREFDIFGKNTL